MIPDSHGILQYGDFPGNSPTNFINGLMTFLMRSGWQLKSRVSASASGGYASLPTNGTVVNAGGISYSWLTSIDNAVPYQVKIATSDAFMVPPGTPAGLITTLQNMQNAINGAGGGQYSTATILNPQCRAVQQLVGTEQGLVIFAKIAGPYGTGIGSTYGTLKGGGYVVQGQSPQLNSAGDQFVVDLSVYDDGNVDGGGHRFVNAKMISAADSSVTSTEKQIYVGGTRRFQVISNQCQFHCFVNGVEADALGSYLGGGILWVPPDSVCDNEIIGKRTLECWWISNDAGFWATPRTVAVDQGRLTDVVDPMDADRIWTTQDAVTAGLANVGTFQNSDGCFNGVMTLGGNARGQFRLCGLSIPHNWTISFGPLTGSVMWLGNDNHAIDGSHPDVGNNAGTQGGIPLLQETLVAWGDSNSSDPLIRGMMYDAMMVTYQYDMDKTRDDFGDGLTWFALTNKMKFGTLWLEVPTLTPITLEAIGGGYAF